MSFDIFHKVCIYSGFEHVKACHGCLPCCGFTDNLCHGFSVLVFVFSSSLMVWFIFSEISSFSSFLYSTSVSSRLCSSSSVFSRILFCLYSSNIIMHAAMAVKASPLNSSILMMCVFSASRIILLYLYCSFITAMRCAVSPF